jgi:alpha-galactosidase
VDDAHQTLVLAAQGDALPAVVYWGPSLPAGEDLAMLAAAAAPDVNGGALDAIVPVTICPQPGRGFAGQPGLDIATKDGGPLLPALRLRDVVVTATGVEILAGDDTLRLTYSARIDTTPSGLLRASAALRSDTPIRLRWLAAPVLPAPQLAEDFIGVSGRWLSEFQLDRVTWTPGIHLREALTGRSGHEHFPGALFPERGATNTAGTVHGFHYGWSGGHRMIAEELSDGRRQVQFGHAAGSERAAATLFETGPLYVTCASGGLNGVAKQFQTHLRDHLVPWPDRDRPRPVHYNCWEAIYFDHDLATLSEIAERAADLGAERFVLDDGWFGRRDDDTTSLGDWAVDQRKWPGGLQPLIDKVDALGMGFGLWVEPEMVNPDSDLYRAHPDWILGPADQTMGRHQYVLDLSRAEVRDYLFAFLDDLLATYPIDYLKWDHNRVLPLPDAGHARGVNDLIDRVRAAHPGVEIESCASGGGRIDMGILSRTHRVWLSDCNDALERLRIQHDAALFLPSCVTGSHVGPRECHSTGRILPMSVRAWVAAQRHLGFEMDLRELTGEESATLRRVTGWYKANRDWMMRGPLLRLDSADPQVIAEVQIAEDGGRFVVFAGQTGTSRTSLPRPLRLTGLDPQASYRVELLNREDIPPHSRGPNALKSGPLDLSGQQLMAQGLTLPVTWPATIWVLEGARL